MHPMRARINVPGRVRGRAAAVHGRGVELRAAVLPQGRLTAARASVRAVHVELDTYRAATLCARACSAARRRRQARMLLRRSCGASCRDGACMAAASSGRSCLQTGGRKSTLHFGDAPPLSLPPPPHDEPTTHTNQAHHDRNRKKKSATFPRRWLTFTLRRPCILILHLRCDRHDTIVDLPCPRICLQMMRAC